ncbi:5'/3'-nucleotidase SurE [Endozoicomonas elysicola]|uniref:5'/3'-nucleotidase SurE n=1 Tax=Endozoicomonas elysicola TaxID=305900 RepID=UPI00036B0830|nr:5'/3'-nucleotidase SurE [Endozoicomonas elysicola]
MKKLVYRAASLLIAGSLSVSASALNVLITNDDGYQSANLRALYDALKTSGHDVMISAPAGEQSGKAASFNYFSPAPVGQDTNDSDIHYVEGTPIMALLYGLDVLAPERWGSNPDLVLSGINSGHNVGLINPTSGTVGATVTAVRRGVPAIALSGIHGSDRDGTSSALAELVVPIIEALKRKSPVLPEGYGLNINLPSLRKFSADSVTYELTTASNYSANVPVFVTDMSPYSIPAYGINLPAEPGIVFTSYEQSSAPEDNNAQAEGRKVEEGSVAISLLDARYGATTYDFSAEKAQMMIRSRLSGLLSDSAFSWLK